MAARKQLASPGSARGVPDKAQAPQQQGLKIVLQQIAILLAAAVVVPESSGEPALALKV
jgi:hypothetical protein